MKNSALILFLSVLIGACSSGNTVSDVPANVTSTFSGSFNDGGGSGTLTLNLSDNGQGVVDGNITVSGNTCLTNASFTGGVSNGFNVTINGIPQTGPDGADTFEVVTTTTTPAVTDAAGVEIAPEMVNISTVIQSSGTVGTQQVTQADGTIVMTVTTLIDGADGASGTLNLQLAVGDGGNTLSGTFVAEGDVCPPGQGSGSIVLSS